MSDAIIKVEGLGKKYIISHEQKESYTALRDVISSKVKGFVKKSSASSKEDFWALKDVSFEVVRGEAIGIIGRNGAGKSTLLKILSRITEPSKGRIEFNGRIASLLEVGTGFHPELTGRENVFLNGAILGMNRAEIKRKFDEIIDFSGVEKFLDTPVKRYSSGMYVRLAFAVAAHLESEILVVDEVLAVGDAEFQKRCLGKMNDVTKSEGRTVLFVSHSMDAITRLCKKAILLNNGIVEVAGVTDHVINHYLQGGFGTTAVRRWDDTHAPGDDVVKLLEVAVHDEYFNTGENFEITKMIGITMKYEVLNGTDTFTHGMNLFNNQGVNILSSHDVISNIRVNKRKVGQYSSTMWIPGNFLSEGVVIVGVAIFKADPFHLHFEEVDAVAFNVFDSLSGKSARGTYVGGYPGIVRPLLQWETSVI